MVHRWRGNRNFQGIERNVEERDDRPWLPLALPMLCRGIVIAGGELCIIMAVLGEAEPNR